MSIKKIILIIFLLCLILLSVGVMVFISRQQGRQDNLRVDLLTKPPLSDAAVNNQPAANPVTVGPAAAPTFSEEQIQQKITDKKKQINAAAKGRTLTDEELYFLSFPREAALNDLKNNK